MKASLLITTRNRAAQLSMALDSIKARKYSGIETIIWDDHSHDNTLVLAARHMDWAKYKRTSQDFAYVKNPARILNAGHALCSSDIVIEQGGEVCHLTDCVKPLLKLCKPGIVALARVYNGTPAQMGQLQELIKQGKYKFIHDYTPLAVPFSGDQAPVTISPENIQLYCCGLTRQVPFLFLGAIHRHDFELVQGYNENIDRNGDGDFAERLWNAGVRFTFSGKAIAFHLEHPKV